MVIKIPLDEQLEKRLRGMKDKVLPPNKKVSLAKFLESMIVLVLEEMEKDEPNM